MAFGGRAHIGGNGTAGEWGHNPLPWMDEDELKYRTEVPCYCGKQGCIETFISGTGFATDYHRLSGQPLKGNEIMRLVEEQDPVAELALSRYEMRPAKSLAHVVNILDPDAIVLGGGMSNVDRLYATVPALVKQWVFGGECETPIRKAVHGDSSGVRGAAWLWPEKAKQQRTLRFYVCTLSLWERAEVRAPDRADPPFTAPQTPYPACYTPVH